MTSTFYSPRNPLAALWASAAETTLRERFPGLTLQEVRQHHMMQGVYLHLRQVGKKQRIENPVTHPETVPAGVNPAVIQAAYLSQHFFNLAITAAATPPLDAQQYQTVVGIIDSINDTLGIADFSTDDILGFGLCLAVWVMLVGPSTIKGAEKDFLIDFLDYLPLSESQKEYVENYIENSVIGQYSSVQYRDANNYPNYGVLPYTIPNGARIVMLGDWGTSLDDAHKLLSAIWEEALGSDPSTPVIFLHLGDIYYCGLPYECDTNFYQVFQNVGQSLKQKWGSSFNADPYIFTLPGNHEYYSYGYGYFELLDTLNKGQQCSFFCLRTQDGNWQFLGMDTGQADGNALLSALQAIGGAIGGFIDSWLPDWGWVNWIEGLANSTYEDWVGPFQPTLQPSEVQWLKAKLDDTTFKGKTIMMSHHQLFSREAEINHDNPVYMNTWLADTFGSYMKSKIAAWYWGHEHSFAVYLDGIMGLNKGRLLGSSSYEATQDSDTPYANNYPMVPFSANMTDTLVNKNADGLYYHAAAILNPSGSNMNVKYYQFPAWTQLDTPPSSPQLTEMTTVAETIGSKFVSLSPTWIGDKNISANNVTTDLSPSLTTWNDHLYMLYINNGSNNGKLTLCTSDVSNFAPTNTKTLPQWGSPATIQINGSSLKSGNSPAVIAVNGKVYGFYIDSNHYIQGICSDAAGISGTSWGSIGNMPTKVSGAGPAVCFFQGRIYIVYRQSGSSNNLCWAFYDIESGAWTDLGAMKYGSTQFESPGSPAISADAFHIYMTYQQKDSSDHDICWAVGTPKPGLPSGSENNISWANMGDITYTKGSTTNKPHTSIGMTLKYADGVFYMIYTADGDSDKLKLWALHGTGQTSTGTWFQGNTVTINRNSSNPSAVDSSRAPSLAITSSGGFLVYRGNTHDEINQAYF